METIFRLLMPYFLPSCPGPDEARAEIMETLESYGALTRSVMLSAAQAIAFGFATLETLHEAKDPELSPSMRLRYRSCANNLTRSCQKVEDFLTKKRLREPAASPIPPAEPTPAAQAQAAATQPAEPLNDLTDPDAEAAIAYARDQINQHRKATGNARPQPARRSSILPTRDLSPEEQAEYDRMWGHAMIKALDGLGMPVQLVNPA